MIDLTEELSKLGLSRETGRRPPPVSDAGGQDAVQQALKKQIRKLTQDVSDLRDAVAAQGFPSSGFSAGMQDMVAGGDADHPFYFNQTSTTGGTLTAGKCFIDGADTTITSLPATLSSVTTTVKYWVSVDRSAKTATWASGAAYPAGSATVNIYPVLEITCAGSVITGYLQRLFDDIVTEAATTAVTIPDHSFKFTKTSDTGGTLTAGLCFIGGVSKTITSLPSTLSSVTSSIKYWVAVELATATATWNSGTSYPASDSDTEIWPILEITCAASKITSYIQRWCADIHLTLTP